MMPKLPGLLLLLIIKHFGDEEGSIKVLQDTSQADPTARPNPSTLTCMVTVKGKCRKYPTQSNRTFNDACCGGGDLPSLSSCAAREKSWAADCHPAQVTASIREFDAWIDGKYKYELAVLSIFRNEAIIMHEWIPHYLSEGVEHFFLINDHSTDNFSMQLRNYSKYVTLIPASHEHAQEKNYNAALPLVQKSARWVAVVDLDEFLYGGPLCGGWPGSPNFCNPTAPAMFMTIEQVINTLPQKVQIGQICTPWKLFGSSGHKKQPPRVVPAFTARWRTAEGGAGQGKCIVRSRAVVSLRVHQHEMMPGYRTVCADAGRSAPRGGGGFCSQSESVLAATALQLNHYVIQS